MAVAKSYENMEIKGEPFERDGKKWVRVVGPCKRCGGSGHYSYNPMDGTVCLACRGSGKESMEVRWYTDSQRASMDKAAEKRKAAAAIKQEERRIKFAARNGFGFGEAGYITLIWGDNETINEWRRELPEHTVWYNELFGWFIPSGREPENIPDTLKSFKLGWECICDINDKENLQMRDREEVKQYVHTLIYGESKSEYQGSPNEWIEAEVTIKKNISLSGQYGDSHMHIMEDTAGNEYVWTTASKNLEEGKTFIIKMKVKEHKEYQGVKQTIVYYCKVK
jgi:hypothetical protein